MKPLFGALLVLVVGLHAAAAAPRKVLVLPIDGTIEPATRTRLNEQVQKLAKSLDGTVTVGDTTFGETAAALGCDAETPACAESVRAMLAVDELVYGRATTTGTETTLVVRRVRSKTTWREGTTTITADETPEHADSTVSTQLAPLFDSTATAPAVVEPPPITTSPATEPVDQPSSARTRGIILAASGSVATVIGVILWLNVNSTQNEIDDAQPEDDDDFADLADKEDKAQRNAIIGDVLVVAGVAVAAWGAWTIYKSGQTEVTIAPTPTTTGAGVTIGGHW